MEFKVIWTIIDMLCAALCLYQAGKFAAVMDIDRADGRRPDTMFQVLYWIDMFLGLYMLIVVYGKGIERGGM